MSGRNSSAPWCAGPAYMEVDQLRYIHMEIRQQTIFFVGTIHFALWERIWKSWVPLRCKFFLCLALLNHCCTADRLPKWGLPHHTSLPSLWLGGKKICSTFPFPLVVSPSSVWVSFLGSNSWRWQILRMMEWIPQTGWQTIQERFEHLDHSCHLGNLETLQDCILNSVSPNANLVVRVVGERHQGKHNNVVCGWCKASLWASLDFLYSFCGVFSRLGRCTLFYWHANYVQWGDVVWGL